VTLGLRTIWVNRLGEEPEPQPDVEQHSLAGLAENLDSLVP
jgi:FMN phosphatase YigB (HAD superfamily)